MCCTECLPLWKWKKGRLSLTKWSVCWSNAVIFVNSEVCVEYELFYCTQVLHLSRIDLHSYIVFDLVMLSCYWLSLDGILRRHLEVPIIFRCIEFSLWIFKNFIPGLWFLLWVKIGKYKLHCSDVKSCEALKRSLQLGIHYTTQFV